MNSPANVGRRNSRESGADVGRTPMQRWGTCCPFDPECDHSFIDEYALAHWMRTPISDDQALLIERDEEDFDA